MDEILELPDATTQYPLTLDSMPSNYVNEPAGSMAPPTASNAPRKDANVVVERVIKFNTSPTPATSEWIYNTNKSDAVYECGQKYPKTLDEFQRIQEEQLEVFAKKMLDYSPANIMLGGSVDIEGDRLGALRGIVIRMNDKMNRLLNIIVRDATVYNESAMDSFLDTSIYSIIALIVDRQTWGK